MKFFTTLVAFLLITKAYCQEHAEDMHGNCLETPAERACCDTAKRAMATLISSEEELKELFELKKKEEYKQYGNLKEVLSSVDLTKENLIIIYPEELPIETQLLAFSTHCGAFRELYGDIPVFTQLSKQRIWLNYHWSGGCADSFYWTKASKSSISPPLQCGCGSVEIKK